MHAKSQAQDMTHCSAITKADKQCSVTSSSNWRDDHGRLVAEPLLKGGEFCLLHAKPFCTKAAQVDDIERLLILILDLETTGIVEIAAVHAHGDARMSCGCFRLTVRVDPDILKERGEEACAVPGLTNKEIRQGPAFEQAWIRFLSWIDDITKYKTDSDDDMSGPTLSENTVVVLVAHNGNRIDFPLLLCELLRNNLSTTYF